jgi:hypothetical protein
MRSGRPEPGEYGIHAAEDIAFVAGDDAVEALARQEREVKSLFGNLTETAVAGRDHQPALPALIPNTTPASTTYDNLSVQGTLRNRGDTLD